MRVINSKQASPRQNQLTLGKFIQEPILRRSLLFSLRQASPPISPSKVRMENNVLIKRRITKIVTPTVLAKTNMEPTKVVSHKAKAAIAVTIIIIIMEDSNSNIIILQVVETVEAAVVEVEMWVDTKIKTFRPMPKQ